MCLSSEDLSPTDPAEPTESEAHDQSQHQNIQCLMPTLAVEEGRNMLLFRLLSQHVDGPLNELWQKNFGQAGDQHSQHAQTIGPAMLHKVAQKETIRTIAHG